MAIRLTATKLRLSYFSFIQFNQFCIYVAVALFLKVHFIMM